MQKYKKICKQCLPCTEKAYGAVHIENQRIAKRSPFGRRKMTFYNVKSHLLHIKRGLLLGINQYRETAGEPLSSIIESKKMRFIRHLSHHGVML